MGNGFGDRFFGDFVENHPVDGLIFQQFFFFQQFIQMPGNGFTLSIRVGRQIEGLGLFKRFGYGLDMALIAFDDFVFHREVVIRVDGALFGDQVSDVTVGGQDLKVLAQIFLDGFRFGRRFYNDKIATHSDRINGGSN